jgi:hypothetical protein
MTTSGATSAIHTRMQSPSAKPRTLRRRVGSALIGLSSFLVIRGRVGQLN